MKNILLLTAIILFTVMGFAQEDEERPYTYVSDRKFYQNTDFYGYTFVPVKYEQDGKKKSLGAGDVMIHLNNGRMFISGLEDETLTMEIISNNKTATGYKVEFIDKFNPTNQGYFRIEMNENYFVVGLILKINTDKAFAFWLPEKSQNDELRDKNLFTAVSAYTIKTAEDLKGKKFKPFMKVDNIFSDFDIKKVSQEDSIVVEFTGSHIVMKRDGQVRRYEVKSTKETQFGYPEDFGPIYAIEIRIKEDKKRKFTVFMNRKNQVEFIEIEDGRYYMKQ